MFQAYKFVAGHIDWTGGKGKSPEPHGITLPIKLPTPPSPRREDPEEKKNIATWVAREVKARIEEKSRRGWPMRVDVN